MTSVEENLARIVVIDTETTGLDEEKDEVLSLAIVDVDGNKLFSSYIRPATRKRWPNAQKIHGITWEDVKDAPTLEELADELAPYFAEGMVVAGYNVGFDKDMLRASGLRIPSTAELDVMALYKEHFELKSYSKLSKAAGRFRYKFEAHGALEDARATAFVLRKILDDEALSSCVDRAERLSREREERAGRWEQEETERREQALLAGLASEKKRQEARWVVLGVAVLVVAAVLYSMNISPLLSLIALLLSPVLLIAVMVALFLTSKGGLAVSSGIPARGRGAEAESAVTEAA